MKRIFIDDDDDDNDDDEDDDNQTEYEEEECKSVTFHARTDDTNRAEVNQHAEWLFTSEKAHSHAVVLRLGVSVQAITRPPTPSSTQGNNRNPKSPDSLSSADLHCPTELNSVYPLTPTRPPLKPNPLCRTTGEDNPPCDVKKKRFSDDEAVSGRCRLQLVRRKVGGIAERLEHFHSSAARRIEDMKTVTLTVAPTLPPDTPTRTRRPCSRTILQAAKSVNRADEKTADDSSQQRVSDKMNESQPLVNPVKSLGLSFSLLDSNDWIKKIDGLKTFQTLVRYHPETVQTKLHVVCLVVTEEVKNLRSAVACAAIKTLAELYVQFQKLMDPEVEGTGRALLLRLAQTSNSFIQEQVKLALDAMVQNCSYGWVVIALLNTGLGHRCAAVRGSTALHLQQVVDNLGAASIFSAGRSFSERFLIAASKLSVDAAPEARHHGQNILKELAQHRDFLKLWTNTIPQKDRWQLDKILKNARK